MVGLVGQALRPPPGVEFFTRALKAAHVPVTAAERKRRLLRTRRNAGILVAAYVPFALLLLVSREFYLAGSFFALALMQASVLYGSFVQLRKLEEAA